MKINDASSQKTSTLLAQLTKSSHIIDAAPN